MPYRFIKNIDIGKITKDKNPYCVDLSKQKNLHIKRDIYDKFVFIE